MYKKKQFIIYKKVFVIPSVRKCACVIFRAQGKKASGEKIEKITNNVRLSKLDANFINWKLNFGTHEKPKYNRYDNVIHYTSV